MKRAKGGHSNIGKNRVLEPIAPSQDNRCTWYCIFVISSPGPVNLAHKNIVWVGWLKKYPHPKIPKILLVPFEVWIWTSHHPCLSNLIVTDSIRWAMWKRYFLPIAKLSDIAEFMNNEHLRCVLIERSDSASYPQSVPQNAQIFLSSYGYFAQAFMWPWLKAKGGI